ncbi:NifB/NifX family molybdenum-iron cluster-binding protein [Malaciobacter canalis]|jgi:predicted Fe-Mo cluster-binding NifX family protein|uniref:NifB/NifX family molybdenum-iron cluster-binding protein n=1 Tax=Malaciobacter canalis TaxID=1912871 RepID=UPI00384D09D5
MKIAIPVKDENLNFFPNAGHTPKFAVYTMTGSGMFKSFKLDEIKQNPRNDIDHANPEADHACDHSHDDAEHIEQHNKMGRVLKECDYIVVEKACKNTARSFTSEGIKLIKYNGDSLESTKILNELSSKFI